MALSDVLGNIPGYGGFIAQQQLGRENRSSDLNNQVNQMKLADLAQGMQRKQALQKIYSATGGDPEKAIPLLMESGFGAEAKQMSDMWKQQTAQQQQQQLGEIGQNIETLQRPDLQNIQGGVGYADIREPELKANIAQATAIDPTTGKQLQEQVFPEAPKQEATPDFAQLMQIRDAYVAKGDTKNAASIDAYLKRLSAPNLTYDPNARGAVAEAVATGKAKGEQVATLPNKQDALTSVENTIELLNKGIYTGAYANVKKAAAKYTPGVDTEKASRTEEFVSEIGNTIIPRLKEFGGNDSNEELRYLQKVSGGDVTYEEGSLRSILERVKFKIQRGIDRINRGLDANGKPITSTAQPASSATITQPKRIKFDAQGNPL